MPPVIGSGASGGVITPGGGDGGETDSNGGGNDTTNNERTRKNKKLQTATYLHVVNRDGCWFICDKDGKPVSTCLPTKALAQAIINKLKSPVATKDQVIPDSAYKTDAETQGA